MIVIKTRYYEWKYYGTIIITINDEMLAIEAHSTRGPRIVEDGELDAWCSDIYDAFWTDDVVSVKGVVDAENS